MCVCLQWEPRHQPCTLESSPSLPAVDQSLWALPRVINNTNPPPPSYVNEFPSLDADLPHLQKVAREREINRETSETWDFWTSGQRALLKKAAIYSSIVGLFLAVWVGKTAHIMMETEPSKIRSQFYFSPRAGTLTTRLGLKVLQVQQWSKVCPTCGGPIFLPLLLSTVPRTGCGDC